jgi:hypothetical protein
MSSILQLTTSKQQMKPTCKEDEQKTKYHNPKDSLKHEPFLTIHHIQSTHTQVTNKPQHKHKATRQMFLPSWAPSTSFSIKEHCNRIHVDIATPTDTQQLASTIAWPFARPKAQKKAFQNMTSYHRNLYDTNVVRHVGTLYVMMLQENRLRQAKFLNVVRRLCDLCSNTELYVMVLLECVVCLYVFMLPRTHSCPKSSLSLVVCLS